MKVTPQFVESMAQLSRMKLTEVELREFAVELDEILHYIDKLHSIDTKVVKPTTFIHLLKAIRTEE